MSIKENLYKLKKENQALWQEYVRVQEQWEKIQKAVANCEERAEKLAARKSALAQQLMKENQSELEKAIQEMVAYEQGTKTDIEKRLAENQSQIDMLEKDTTAYIEEQVKRMVPEFLEYVKGHMMEIGRSIKQHYSIRGLKVRNTVYVKELDERLTTNVWTGEVGIFGAEETESITASKDFYFKQQLYTIGYDVADIPCCISTMWYKQYLKDFTVAFQKKLQESYCYAETLKLTITQDGFMLELV